MAAVTDHYEIGFTISGDRHIFSTDGEWDMHSGYVGTSPLNLPHQSFSTSDVVYDGILIKYSFKIADIIKTEISPAVFNKFYNERFHILNETDRKYIQQLFEQMHNEYKINSNFTNIKLMALLELIITYTIEHQISIPITDTSIQLNPQISTVMRYIDNNYFNKISLNVICNTFGFSPAHFSRLFKQATGDTFSRYLSKVRFEHAVTLLLTTNKSIELIAFECGFGSLSYFSYAFKKEFLKSPQNYRIDKKTESQL